MTYLLCSVSPSPYSDWPTIPQVYLKGEFLGGCDLILGMHQSGELTGVRSLDLWHNKIKYSILIIVPQMLQESKVIDKEAGEQPAPTDAGAS
jgi:monothiol glutaredoxin